MAGEHEEVIVSKTAVDARVHELGEGETVTAGVLLEELHGLSGRKSLGGASGVRDGRVSGGRHFCSFVFFGGLVDKRIQQVDVESLRITVVFGISIDCEVY